MKFESAVVMIVSASSETGFEVSVNNTGSVTGDVSDSVVNVVGVVVSVVDAVLVSLTTTVCAVVTEPTVDSNAVLVASESLTRTSFLSRPVVVDSDNLVVVVVVVFAVVVVESIVVAFNVVGK